MKTLLAFALALTFVTSVRADEHVNGYDRQDGTHVNGYERTSPNGTTSDNYSHSGNTNPYTGEEGHKNN